MNTALAFVSTQVARKTFPLRRMIATKENHLPHISTAENFVAQKRSSHEFGFGSLSLEQYDRGPNDEREGPNTQVRTTRVLLSFVPAYWLSRVAIWAQIDFVASTTIMALPLGISLRAKVVNNDPEVSTAIRKFDVSKLQALFQSGQARPTDMIVDFIFREPTSLLDVRSSA